METLQTYCTCSKKVEKFRKLTATRNFDSYNGYTVGLLLLWDDISLNA